MLLSVVDLRWGVTDAAAADAATLLVCLREVEKCNVFVGIYGARYGLSLSADALKGFIFHFLICFFLDFVPDDTLFRFETKACRIRMTNRSNAQC